MYGLSFSETLGRQIRQGRLDSLGEPTQRLIKAAFLDGEDDAAGDLADYTVAEGKGLHDLFCDWIWDLLTRIADTSGEEEMGRMLKQSQAGWMMRRSWRGYLKLSVEDRVALTAEIMRSHRCGPGQDGELTIRDDGDSIAIVMDPCGSGGRMRRGDPVDGTPSRLGPPYDFGVTKKAHDWSFGQKGVPYYCVHCAMNELLMMEWGGHPLWVTAYDPDASKPCAWIFYRNAAAIPEHYYTRAGRTKPAAGEGQF